jgi:hypothetical protein
MSAPETITEDELALGLAEDARCDMAMPFRTQARLWHLALTGE